MHLHNYGRVTVESRFLEPSVFSKFLIFRTKSNFPLRVKHFNFYSRFFSNLLIIDLSRIPVNKGTSSRFWWTKYSDLYEIVHREPRPHFFMFTHWSVMWERSIAHIRYSKILTWLRGFRVKIANFSQLHCLAIPIRDLSTKKTKPNTEKWPQSLQSC